MALDFKLAFCIREANGTLTARVIPLVDGKEWEKSIEVQGKTADELEASMRLKIKDAKARYDSVQTLTGTAQDRLDKIKTELGISSTGV